MGTLADFVEKWCTPDYPPSPVTKDELDSAQAKLAVVLPEEYLRAVLQVGLPSATIALLNSIVENDMNIHDIAEFFTPEEMVDRTVTWKTMGLPEQMTAFASDGMGNLFVFVHADEHDGAIGICDHDNAEVKILATSFDAWIAMYESVPSISLEDALRD